MLELGTKQYPYRTMKSVSSEILNQLTAKNANITILLKEGSKVYIQDDTTYFLSMGSVTVASYSDSSSKPGRALLVPTAIVQHGITERAAYHILENTDLPIILKIEGHGYGDIELFKLRETQITFKIALTSFSLLNVNVYREQVDYNGLQTFMYPISLQNRNINVSKWTPF
jgi:hypothetical protein